MILQLAEQLDGYAVLHNLLDGDRKLGLQVGNFVFVFLNDVLDDSSILLLVLADFRIDR